MKKIPVGTTKLRIGFKGIVNSTDESVLGMEYAVTALNFTFRNGALRSDIGIQPARGYTERLGSAAYFEFPELPAGVAVKGIFVYHRRGVFGYDDRLVVHTAAGELYYAKIFDSTTQWTKIDQLSLTGELSAVNYTYNDEDVLLLSSAEDQLVVLNDTVATTLYEAPCFTSIVVHNERVYGTVDGYDKQVWFSDDFNPTNWKVGMTEGGFITFNDECGRMLKVMSFLNYLYIFREHGIFRLTAYGDQSQFSLKKLFTNTGRILKNTIASCGDKIMFEAEEGVYIFDGYDVRRAVKELPELYLKERNIGAYSDNRYYLACQVDNSALGADAETDYMNNAIIQYDLRDESMSILCGPDVCVMASMNVHNATDLLLALRQPGYTNRLGAVKADGKFFSSELKKVYVSPVNSLMNGRVKIVRDVTLTTRRDIELTVCTDDTTHKFPIKGSSRSQTVFIGKSGRNIGFRIETYKINNRISPIVATVELM